MQPHHTISLCSIPDCGRTVKARGWCKYHYERWQKRGDPVAPKAIPKHLPTETLFWRNVDRTTTPDGCWPWIGTRRNGYGRFRVDGVMVSAHRYAYELQVGPIPEGHDVLHKCDNPPCNRGSHFFTGTHTDNMRDMVAKGRRIYPTKTHCPKGHSYIPENSMTYAGKRGRGCRTCFNEHRAVPCLQCGAMRSGKQGTGLCQQCYFNARYPQRLQNPK